MTFLIERYNTVYTELYNIETTYTNEGFPLSKLLLLITNSKLGIHNSILILYWLQPISLIELSQFPAQQVHEYQRNYYLIGLAERLGIDQSQLLQLWNHTLQRI